MRMLAHALQGRLTRRAITHSPHTWRATAAVFLIFSLSDLQLALMAPGVHVGRLFVISGYCAVVGIGVFLTRPPEPGSIGSHVIVALVYCGVSLAVFAHAPQGSGPVMTGMFIPTLIALWISERKHAAAHLLLASIGMLCAALLGGNDVGTLVAVLAFIPTSVLLLVSVIVVLDAVDAQGEALDQLARRDPLTGVGNRRMLLEELGVELTRHESNGRQLAVVDLALQRFELLNQRVGRAAGDAVLTAVACSIRDAAPAGATVTRSEGAAFTVLLPDSNAEAAEAFIVAVRRALPQTAGGRRLELAGAAASFPSDGRSADALTSVAAARRDATGSLSAVSPAQEETVDRGAWTVVMDGLEPAPLPALPRRVLRSDIATDPLVWRITTAGFLLYALVVLAAHQFAGLGGSSLLIVVGVCVAFGLFCLASKPPAIGTPRNQLTISASYLLPIGAMLATAPELSWVVGTAILAPLLTAARLTSRRQILAHLAVLTLACAAMLIAHITDQLGSVALMALLLNTSVLGACTTVVFEAAERQSGEIAQLILQDPLTGAANTDLFMQRLAEELPRHDDLQLALTVMTIELDGIPELTRDQGRGAVNLLLRDIAGAMTTLLGPQATVARMGGSRFRVLMPFTEAADILPLTGRLRGAIFSATRRGVGLTPRIGVVEYPEEAVGINGMLQVADARCADDDPTTHGPLDDEHGVLSDLPELRPRPSGYPAARPDAAAEQRRAS